MVNASETVTIGIIYNKKKVLLVRPARIFQRRWFDKLTILSLSKEGE